MKRKIENINFKLKFYFIINTFRNIYFKIQLKYKKRMLVVSHMWHDNIYLMYIFNVIYALKLKLNKNFMIIITLKFKLFLIDTEIK